VKTFTGIGIAVSLVLGTVVGRGLAQDEKKPCSNEPPGDEAHRGLARLAGRFDAAVKLWSDSTSAPRESSGRIENKLVHGGRFLLSDYSGRLGDKPYTGTNLLGYDDATKRYTNVWVDSTGSSTEVATGTCDAAGKTLTLQATPDAKVTWIFRLEDDDHYALELHAGQPGGDDRMFFQVVYTRVKASDGDVTARKKPEIGSVAWRDLTVKDAESVRKFYGDVVGWKSSELDVGGTSDFTMATPGSGEVVAGICHARGVNAKLPAQWLLYITVADVDRSSRRCVELGGKVLDGPRAMGGQRFCVIQDPAGAVAGLIGK
jgi:predicted enzyme related to lactoylglutathione lyase